MMIAIFMAIIGILFASAAFAGTITFGGYDGDINASAAASGTVVVETTVTAPTAPSLVPLPTEDTRCVSVRIVRPSVSFMKPRIDISFRGVLGNALVKCAKANKGDSDIINISDMSPNGDVDMQVSTDPRLGALVWLPADFSAGAVYSGVCNVDGSTALYAVEWSDGLPVSLNLVEVQRDPAEMRDANSACAQLAAEMATN